MKEENTYNLVLSETEAKYLSILLGAHMTGKDPVGDGIYESLICLGIQELGEEFDLEPNFNTLTFITPYTG